MSYFDRTLGVINENKSREHNAIPFGLRKLESIIPGLSRGTYACVTAGTKVGKTTFVDTCYLYNAYECAKRYGIRLKIFYWSMEISTVEKIIKGISRNIWRKYSLIINRNEILSLSRNRLSDEKYRIIADERDYFEELEDVVTIFDGSENPTGIYKVMKEYALSNGRMEGSVYVANRPDEIVLGILDHYALLNTERGMDKRTTIEKQSEYCVLTRNLYGHSWVAIQQQAASKESAQYTSSGRLLEDRFEPSIDGLGDCKTVSRDVDYMLSLYSPIRHGISKHNGIIVDENYRSLKIMLNRNGDSDIYIPIHFNGLTGEIREL
jgi:hypothetical protein